MPARIVVGGHSSCRPRGVLILVAVAVASAFAPSGLAAAGDDAAGKASKTVRLLTVGNSFSRNATQYLGDLATAAGHVLIHHQAVIGGGTLEQHWVKARKHEDDPGDPLGLYTSKRSLKQELLAEPWDFATIQQASIRSHDASTYRPFARELYDYIKKYAPGAEILTHETWAYRRDDPRFGTKPVVAGEPADQEAMYRGLAAAYAAIAAELGTRTIPVGDAFFAADCDPSWGYRPDPKFDLESARYPAVPDQAHSLHVGWRWLKQADGRYALKMDGHHANVAGQYLGSCVFYEVLFGESVVGNPFVPRGLNAADARYLQETAHRAVARRGYNVTK
jgi:hypothetical protein